MKGKGAMNLRETQAAETKQKLLDSAQTLFAENGYKGTAVRDINRRIGLADGLLYHYFPEGKKEIFQVVVEQNISQILMTLSEKNRMERYLVMPLEEGLALAGRNFVSAIERHMDIIRILFRENEVREFVTKGQMSQLLFGQDSWFQTLLEKKYEMGEIKKMDFESAGIVLNGMLMHHVFGRVFGAPVEMEEELAHWKKIIAYQVELWKC